MMNNCMEMQVVIEVLKVLKKLGCIVVLIMDSVYLCDGIIKWIYGWKKCGWKIVDKKLVKNVDFWQELDVLICEYMIEWCWVKGYVGDLGNECVDELVCEGIVGLGQLLVFLLLGCSIVRILVRLSGLVR